MCCARGSARSSRYKGTTQGVAGVPAFRPRPHPATTPRLSAFCPRTLFAQPQRFRLHVHDRTPLCTVPRFLLSAHALSSVAQTHGFRLSAHGRTLLCPALKASCSPGGGLPPLRKPHGLRPPHVPSSIHGRSLPAVLHAAAPPARSGHPSILVCKLLTEG